MRLANFLKTVAHLKNIFAARELLTACNTLKTMLKLHNLHSSNQTLIIPARPVEMSVKLPTADGIDYSSNLKRVSNLPTTVTQTEIWTPIPAQPC